LGCPSAYQRTYDEQYQKLEQQAQQQQAVDAAAHAAAQRFAAVVYFDVGKASLSSDGERELRWLVDRLRPYPEANLDVQGFADATGGDATNARLSAERAQAVARYLESQGIAASRMAVEGFSTRSPAASNVTAEGRKNNRRVEVTVR
jgi:outer membrane protein OmpA-like peptidoglycan-associated protein